MSDEKKVEIPEESVAMRVLCGILAVIAITVSFVFGKSPIPVIDFSPMQATAVLLSIWLCIGGSMLSYYYRHEIPKVISTLIKVGAVLIVLNLARELILDNLHAQQFQFLYPLVDALVAASILTSFELKTRNDILSSAAFGLCLMAIAACSGRSIIFGACVFLYIILGTALLTLAAQSQTAEMPHADKRLVTASSRGIFRPAIVLCATLLPILSVAVFSVLPRLDAEADSLSSHVRSWASATIYDARQQKQSHQQLIEESATRRHKYTPPDEQIVDTSGDHPNDNSQKTKPSAKQSIVADNKENVKDTKKQNPKDKLSQEQTVISTAQQGDKEQPKDNSSDKSGDTAKQATNASTSPTKPADKTIEPQDKNIEQQDKTDKLFQKLVAHYRKRKSALASSTTSAPTDPSLPPTSPTPNVPNQNSTVLPNKPIPTSVENKPKNKADSTAKAPPIKNEALAKALENGTIPSKDGASSAGSPQIKSKKNAIARLDASDISLEDSASNAETPVFTLACNRNVYVKTSCLDYFDGHQWTRTDQKDYWTFNPTEKGVDISDCPPLTFTDALPVMELTENFTLKADFGYMVPLAGIPQKLSMLNEVNVDNYGDVTSALPMIKGTSYTAVCQWPVYAVEELRHTKSYADPDTTYTDKYLQLPKNQSQETIDLANGLIEPGFNRFVQAEHITTYLRNHYDYKLDPQQGEPDDNLADQFLLNRKSGDCKAFATAFVVLCRAAGIPARFVAGFMPGDFDPVHGSTTVKLKHGHAWAEIYMAPYGWVAFDPTPGGLLPARPEQKYYNYHELHKQITKDTTSSAAKTLLIVESAFRDIGYVIALSAVALTITAFVFSIRASRHVLSQLWDAIKPKHPAVKARNRVLNRLRKLGVVREPSDTAQDVVRRLENKLANSYQVSVEDTDLLQKEVTEFFDVYNAIYFGNYTKELPRLKSLASSITEQIK